MNKTAISLVSIQQNDSTATMAVGEIYDLAGLMEILGRLGDKPAKASLAMVEGAELSIPTNGLTKAIAQFREACGV